MFCYVLKSESFLKMWFGEKERWLEVGEERRRLDDSGSSIVSSANNIRKKEGGRCTTTNFPGTLH